MTTQLEISEQQHGNKTIVVAIFASFAATWIFGIVPVLIRWSENEISPSATMFNRCWIASIMFVLWQELLLLRQRRSTKQLVTRQSLDNKQILLLLVTSVSFFATQLLWALSITQTSIANSAFLHSLTPFFTALGGWLLFNQRFNSKFLSGLFITAVGTIILGLDDLQIASIKLQGDSLAFISAFFWSIYLLTVEKLRTKLSATTILTWVCSISTLLFGLVVFTLHEEWFPHSWKGWLTVIALALTLILAHGLLAYSLKHLSSTFIALINFFDPIVTASFSWIVFGEAFSRLNLIAFAIILPGIYLALSNDKKVEEQAEEIKASSSESTNQA
ncbi:MAG: DMT family transporter [Stigonema ocellatum SAG 48.90 = DSM 106950]|nr:DMT family transporter [Stigonema ocellatum SAG 48.90 = DSM 106950]